ncbi:MAG: FG-GAP-like repeat-containing protein [Phycisphaerales bacterium]|nr:FG-GAP-like repeat-containing protein [Phycisphaerales bacterium]
MAALSSCFLLAASSPKKTKPELPTPTTPLERSTITSNWEDVTTTLLSSEGHENHRGSAWCDFDNDGLLDLYTTHFGVHYGGNYFGSPNQLLRNMGDGEFIEVTTEVSAVGSDLSHHSCWADIDNDGLPDLFVGQSTNYGQDQNHLLHHDSVGIFSDITNGNPLAMFWLSPRAVTWQDVNLDGFVDLYITNSGGDQRIKRLLINQGDNTFVKEEDSGLDGIWDEGRGAAWTDYDNDGLADLYVVAGAEDNSDEQYRTNALYRNNGDGTWADVAQETGVADVGHGRGVCWGDINNDGFMDLLVGNQVGSDHPGNNKLYLNNGDGTFIDISETSGISENARTRCVSMADYNNDGLIDLYTVTFGSTGPPNRLYHNNGDGTFVDVAEGTPVTAPNNGNSATWADYDNDGWIDLYTVGGSSFAPGVGQNRLCRNMNHNGNHWIELELCGTVSNRSAIGTRITISHRNSENEIVNQMREVQSGNGYNSQHMFRAHFGLGSSEIIDEVTITWPSGIIQTTNNLATDQILRVVENDVFAIDCNRNCVDDALDISDGTSLDTNNNDIPDECECVADFDSNNSVDVHDLLILIADWGATSSPADLNDDGIVDIHDLLNLVAGWGDCS